HIQPGAPRPLSFRRRLCAGTRADPQQGRCRRPAGRPFRQTGAQGFEAGGFLVAKCAGAALMATRAVDYQILAQTGRTFRLERLPLSAFVAPLALLPLWPLACLTGLFAPQVLVPPSGVAKALADMTASGELQRHVGDSLQRLLIGFVIGALAGMAFGATIALSQLAEAAFSPTFLTLWQVPVIAFVPMMVMFLGIDEPFKVAVVAIASFFPMALATFDGIRGVP